MAITYQGRDGELRIYDGSGTVFGNNTGTPFYITVKFAQMDFAGPLAKPRPIDPVIVTADGFVHAPTGDDYEARLYEPVPLGFSCLIDDTTNRQKLRDALCNPDLDSPWQVGSDNWASTKGRGSIILPDGNFVGTKGFFDTKKVAVMVEVLWEDSRAAASLGMQYDEVYVLPQEIEIAESPDRVELAVRNMLAYGDISAISSFTTGNKS